MTPEEQAARLAAWADENLPDWREARGDSSDVADWQMLAYDEKHGIRR